MIKIDFKWDHKAEKKLFNFFRRTAFLIFSGKKIDTDYSSLVKIFVNYSVSCEKKFKKLKKRKTLKILTIFKYIKRLRNSSKADKRNKKLAKQFE